MLPTTPVFYLRMSWELGFICSALKKPEQSADYKKQLEQLLEGKEEEFKKTMLENLQKQLKEIH